MAQQWVYPSRMSNAMLEELRKKFAKIFAISFHAGTFYGGAQGLSGSSAYWRIVQYIDDVNASPALSLHLSADSTTWIVERSEGDVSEIEAKLAEEGFVPQG